MTGVPKQKQSGERERKIFVHLSLCSRSPVPKSYPCSCAIFVLSCGLNCTGIETLRFFQLVFLPTLFCFFPPKVPEMQEKQMGLHPSIQPEKFEYISTFNTNPRSQIGSESQKKKTHMFYKPPPKTNIAELLDGNVLICTMFGPIIPSYLMVMYRFVPCLAQ